MRAFGAGTHRRVWLFGAALLLAVDVGCGENPVEGSISGGDETDDAATISCQPGSVVACDCDGRPGLRECLASGAEFSACQCEGEVSTTGEVGSTGTSDETTSTMAVTESEGTTDDGSTTEDNGDEATGASDDTSTGTVDDTSTGT